MHVLKISKSKEAGRCVFFFERSDVFSNAGVLHSVHPSWHISSSSILIHFF
jgi:hypothetical protein